MNLLCHAIDDEFIIVMGFIDVVGIVYLYLMGFDIADIMICWFQYKYSSVIVDRELLPSN